MWQSPSHDADVMHVHIYFPASQKGSPPCVSCGRWPSVELEIDGILTSVCARGGCLAAAWRIVHGLEVPGQAERELDAVAS